MLYILRRIFCAIARRGDYRLWIDTQIKGTLARWSVHIADCTVAPSAAFASALRSWSGKAVAYIHHGFDHEVFFREPAPLATSEKRNSRRRKALCAFCSSATTITIGISKL